MSSQNFLMVAVNMNAVIVSGGAGVYTLTDTLQRKITFSPTGVSNKDSSGYPQTM